MLKNSGLVNDYIKGLRDMMRIKDRVEKFIEIIKGTFCTDYYQSIIDLEEAAFEVTTRLYSLQKNKNTLYIVGNGGSAAVASHALVDFINVAKINARVLHESSLVTCMANDFGYENVYSKVLSQIIKPNDVLIAISSSGKSENICNAAIAARSSGNLVISFTGFSKTNRLRSLGDINFWLDSNDYGFVEVGHQFLLHNLSDRFMLENMRFNDKLVATEV